MRTQVNQSAHDLRSSTCQYFENNSQLLQYSNLSLFLEKSWPSTYEMLKADNILCYTKFQDYSSSYSHFLRDCQCYFTSSAIVKAARPRRTKRTEKRRLLNEGEFHLQLTLSFDSINGDKRQLSVLFFFFCFINWDKIKEPPRGEPYVLFFWESGMKRNLIA